MATIPQIKGLILEEALLFLLQLSGYRVVGTKSDVRADKTLHLGRSGIEVKGRGLNHQIDAIADYRIAHPFSYPQRLLVEAKFYTSAVGVQFVRNAVGVLKDVSEFWVSGGRARLLKQRYHYQYALFSTSGYTKDAEQYAFAQDIFLIPLANSKFLKPLIQVIEDITPATFGSQSDKPSVDLQDLRKQLRRRLGTIFTQISPPSEARQEAGQVQELVERLGQECDRLNGALLAMINQRFPIFLVPSSQESLFFLHDQYYPIEVRIRWDEESWYLDSVNNRRLFSFDLPEELFRQYADQNLLSRESALNLKQETMSEIQATIIIENNIRVVTFKLDMNWLQELKNKVGGFENRR